MNLLIHKNKKLTVYNQSTKNTNESTEFKFPKIFPLKYLFYKTYTQL